MSAFSKLHSGTKSLTDKTCRFVTDYLTTIIGRMGIPYHKRGISIISIALDAPQDAISALAGKIGNLEGISVKTAYSSVIGKE